MRQVQFEQEDVIQALCAALLWGEDAGMDALMKADRDAGEGIPTPCSCMVQPRRSVMATMSPAARELLALAQSQLPVRSIGHLIADGLMRYDLRRAGP